ncbi:plasmid segregation protein ParM [Paenacidovorax caeni]|uniref:Plasmid segregation protein ParM n=2 Tax=Paenacidovorax caeni TaxID=343013 RepID=A0A1I7KQF4_9BURK|nr:plasmid segregation protein ParM [Paenacidovorax caeni]
MNEVDVLVTGLPVDQYKDEARRAELERQFIGKHKITPKRTVEIAQVKVVAQPTGGLFDMISQDDEENPAIDEDARILVVDPGFFREILQNLPFCLVGVSRPWHRLTA